MKRKAYWIPVVLILLLGIAMRYVQYRSDRPLWADEAMLSVNIISRSYRGLLTPLLYEQQSPVGFLMTVKWMTTLLGTGEETLRLVSFVAGIVSLAGMMCLSLAVLPFWWAVLSLYLFAGNDILIYYASEVKPYMTDVAVGLLLVLAFLSVRRRRKLLFFTGIAGLWFSQASVFILAGIGVVEIWTAIRRGDKRALLVWMAIIGAWMASFLIQSNLTLGQYYGRYRNIWQPYYAPFPPFSYQDISWYSSIIPQVIQGLSGMQFWPLALALCLAGLRSFWSESKRKFFLFFLPPAFAFTASVLHFYPFFGRFLLIFAPTCIICLTEGVRRIVEYSRRRPWVSMRILAVVVAAGVVWSVGAQGIYRLRNPVRFEVITPCIRYYKEHRQAGDTLYLYYGAAFAFDYYAERYSISQKDIVKGIERTDNTDEYRADLAKLSGRKRVWVLFSHVYDWGRIDEGAFFTGVLDHMGKKLDEVRTDGAALYLYDLSPDNGK